MNRKPIYIFEFPSNLGLKKKDEDFEPGVKTLPHWLRKYHFHKLVNPYRVFTLQPPAYAIALDKESRVRNADKIIAYAKSQADLLARHMEPHQFAIILGGDCSILIGNAIALRLKGDYGLFFMDGHTDYVSPENSSSKAAAAMELAIVTGYGHEKLTNIHHLKPYICEKNVWCIGNRELDPKIVNEILESDINYFDLNRLRKAGPGSCTLQFLKMVDQNQLDGFFIHLDVDILNDDIMPAVDSRQKNGLSYTELNQLLYPLLSSDKGIGIEITILDPTLDPGGIHTTKFISNFVRVMEKAMVRK